MVQTGAARPCGVAGGDGLGHGGFAGPAAGAVRPAETRQSPGLRLFHQRPQRQGRQLRANPRASACSTGMRSASRCASTDALRRCRRRRPTPTGRPARAEKQLAARASEQSAAAGEPRRAGGAVEEIAAGVSPQPIPRPPEWVGFRIIPDAVEFWHRGEHRLHDRELYVRTRGGWKRTRLQP